MSSEKKTLTTILVASILLVVGAVFFLSRNTSSPQNSTDQIYQIDYNVGQKVGSDSAKVKLVEFSDFQCPACAAVNPAVESIVNEKGDNVQLIYRHFPLPQHTNAYPAALAAEAAGKQGKFYPYHLELFKKQDEWSNLENTREYFIKLAADTGLDTEVFSRDLDDPSLRNNVNRDTTDAIGLNIEATPTFFVNGKKVNITKLEDLKVKVEESLAQP